MAGFFRFFRAARVGGIFGGGLRAGGVADLGGVVYLLYSEEEVDQ